MLIEDTTGKGLIVTNGDRIRTINLRLYDTSGGSLDVDANSTSCVFDILLPEAYVYSPPSVAGSSNILLFDGVTPYIADNSVGVDKLNASLQKEFVQVEWGTPGSETVDEILIEGTLKRLGDTDLIESMIVEVAVMKDTELVYSSTGTISAVDTGTALTPLDQNRVRIQSDSNGVIAIKVHFPGRGTVRLAAIATYGSNRFFRDADTLPTLTFT